MHFGRISHNAFFTSRPCVHACSRPRLKPSFQVQRQTTRLGRSRQFSSSSNVYYATHHDTPSSSLLSQTLDQRQRMARASQADNVGPFTLGMVQPGIGSEKPMKKWSELDVKGKVARSTARTTNFTVIVIGAGLTAMLAYALASELFARNSPTVLYGEACSKIKASDEIARHLHAPLTFHNNPPTTNRPKHRNRHVSSQLAVDSQGREHLILNFYVRGSPPGSSSQEDENYFDRARRTLEEGSQVLRDITWDEAVAWGHNTLQRVKEKARRLFLYLTGELSSSSGSSSYPYPNAGSASASVEHAQSHRRETQIGRADQEQSGGFWSGITGLFSGMSLRSAKESGSGSKGGLTDPLEIFEKGEIHCDLVKDDSGNFVWRYIIVDMPNSRARYPNRIFVERSPEVRENEPVMRWY